MKKLILFFLLNIMLICTNINAGQHVSKPLLADTATITKHGNTFIAPAKWTLSSSGAAIIIESPEGNSRIVLVDVEAENADEAIAKGWKEYKKNKWPLKMSSEQSDNNGWFNRQQYEYQTSPNEKRSVYAGVMSVNNLWTVWIYDMATDVAGKRRAQINLIFSSLYPKGYTKETFAGKKAHSLTDKKLTELKDYINKAIKTTGVPGVGLGIIQNGKVVFAGGFGVRELNKPAKVDSETLFMIGSNTKAMTTLLLAKLVDEDKLTWKTPVTKVMPSFRLGDDKTTSRVLIEHLLCACTGLPRKDMEWIFEFGDLSAEGVMAELARTQPTSDFGEMYQYSNPLAAAAGYVGGHALFPNLGLGEAYDKAMQVKVFDPLGMNSTTFDFTLALSRNHAEAFGNTIDGETVLIDMNINKSVIPVRPAGAAWSNVNDMLRYIAFELDKGVLPNGKRYVSKKSLFERRKPKVYVSKKVNYGMGLIVDETYGVPVITHTGATFGYYSQMMWLPEHGVGAIILTNGDPGWLISPGFSRKLLEVLFDGNNEADDNLYKNTKRYFEQIATNRKLYDMPADAKAVKKLSVKYKNEALGIINVKRDNDDVIFDFGEFQSRVTTKQNGDGTISFIAIDPEFFGAEFVVGSESKPQLIFRDAQHEYIFEGL